MIKPGYTYRTTWTGDPVIVYVVRRNGHVMQVELLTGHLQGQDVTIRDNDRPWVEVCEGRHSNPGVLLTQTDEPAQMAWKGLVRKGRGSGARYEVLGVHGDQVWTHSTGGDLPPGDNHMSWSLKDFLESTVEMSTFFEEGHDYERRIVAGGVIRVTVRHVGQMPMGKKYAVAERRSGESLYDPILLTSYDFPTYEDVTR